MRKIIALIFAAALLLTGCRQPEAPVASALDLWVTSQDRADTYAALETAWNEAHPQEPIHLNISVYSSRSITSKFSQGVSANGVTPDLVELDYAAFPEFVFQQTADLYPLQNLLDKNEGSVGGVDLYSKNGICFALPYQGQQLVLCYRLDLEDRFPDWRHEATSFEVLLELGKTYAEQEGEPLLWVDYLGSELFLGLYFQALEGLGEEEAAYEAVVSWLEEAQQTQVSHYLPSGDAYSDTFSQMLVQGQIPCFVTTCANLQTLSRQEETLGEQYGVMALPSFRGIRRRVEMPAVAVAVHLSGGDPVLSRDFLEFCRFSEASKAYPAFYLGADSTGIGDLSDSFRVLGSLQQAESGVSLTAIELETYLTNYSQQVLGLP